MCDCYSEYYYGSREETIEALESYQKELEKELAELSSRIEELKKEKEQVTLFPQTLDRFAEATLQDS